MSRKRLQHNVKTLLSDAASTHCTEYLVVLYVVNISVEHRSRQPVTPMTIAQAHQQRTALVKQRRDFPARKLIKLI